MKNLGYILILSLFLVLAHSCGDGSREASVPSFKETLTKEDTVAVLQRCDSSYAGIESWRTRHGIRQCYHFCRMTKGHSIN